VGNLAFQELAPPDELILGNQPFRVQMDGRVQLALGERNRFLARDFGVFTILPTPFAHIEFHGELKQIRLTFFVNRQEFDQPSKVFVDQVTPHRLVGRATRRPSLMPVAQHIIHIRTAQARDEPGIILVLRHLRTVCAAHNAR